MAKELKPSRFYKKTEKPKKPPKPVMREYEVRMLVTLKIKVDQRLFDSVLTDEWRAQMYPFHTNEDVVKHLAFNMVHGRNLQSLDGFADQPYERVATSLPDIDIDEVVDLNE
jgi:hypothetical protein